MNGIKYHAKNGHRTQIRVHKPFKCRCGKSYKTSQGLRHHTINFHPPCLHWDDAEDAVVGAEEMSSAVSQVMSAELFGHQHWFSHSSPLSAQLFCHFHYLWYEILITWHLCYFKSLKRSLEQDSPAARTTAWRVGNHRFFSFHFKIMKLFIFNLYVRIPEFFVNTTLMSECRDSICHCSWSVILKRKKKKRSCFYTQKDPSTFL